MNTLLPRIAAALSSALVSLTILQGVALLARPVDGTTAAPMQLVGGEPPVVVDSKPQPRPKG